MHQKHYYATNSSEHCATARRVHAIGRLNIAQKNELYWLCGNLVTIAFMSKPRQKGLIIVCVLLHRDDCLVRSDDHAHHKVTDANVQPRQECLETINLFVVASSATVPGKTCFEHNASSGNDR